jgi:hypothetical protein
LLIVVIVEWSSVSYFQNLASVIKMLCHSIHPIPVT